ncbi:hypothetical protein HDU81_010424 [Chytriomyces hyalinus]|nr:hypothetical protein HDU81_010424 [Chytriomyces hyalinus]
MPILAPATGLWSLPFVGLHMAFQFGVIFMRRRHKITIGDGSAQVEALVRAERSAAEIAKAKEVAQKLGFRIRAQANFIENAPLALLLVAVAELNGLAAGYAHALLGVLFVARVAHYMALSNHTRSGVGIGRAGGVVLTQLVLVGAAGCSLAAVAFK